MSTESQQPSWLLQIINRVGYGANGEAPTLADDTAKEQITAKLLNLIEQAKDKSLPLTWLTGEIKKL
jgi:hypothetical protein